MRASGVLAVSPRAFFSESHPASPSAMLFGSLCFELCFPVLEVSFVNALFFQCSGDADNGVHTFRVECSQCAGFYADHLCVVTAHQEDFLGAMLAGMCANAFDGYFFSCKVFCICKKRVNFLKQTKWSVLLLCPRNFSVVCFHKRFR